MDTALRLVLVALVMADAMLIAWAINDALFARR
jgi:hypothetical protein